MPSVVFAGAFNGGAEICFGSRWMDACVWQYLESTHWWLFLRPVWGMAGDEAQEGISMKLKWFLNEGEYEAFYDGHWGFVRPEPRQDPTQYRAYDGRFPRTEFGVGFLGVFPTLYQAASAIETAWGMQS